MAGLQRVVMMVVAVVVSQVLGATERYGDCTRNTHCAPSQCCLVGMNRYSAPFCAPRGALGDWCRLQHNSPRPMTLHYPNDLIVEVEEGHSGMCPCMEGLECSRPSSTCQAPAPPSYDSSYYDSRSNEDNSIGSFE